MHRRILTLAAVAAAFTIPVSAATVVLGSSSPASASSSLSCAKLTGNINNNVTITKCTPLTKAEKKTYKSGSAVALDLAEGGTITWSSSGATTIISAPTLTTGPGTCKTSTKNPVTEETATGTVTGGNAAVTNNGDTFYAEVCVNNNSGAITLVKGTYALL
jgi:hypothetical protein